MLEFSFSTLCKLIIEMFIFSCAGWLMEVTLKYIQFHRFINRGFLIGPYCPIYGSGVVAVTVFVGGIVGYEGSYAETFLAGFVICGALEYFVSWYMEKMFHARWWDYSTKPMNLNGRIWIGNLILFGLGSVIIIKWIDPEIFRLLAPWPKALTYGLACVIVVLLAADNVASHFLMNIVKKEIDSREEDNTEEISMKVRELLRNHKLLLRRIEEAYPNLQARPKHLTDQLKAARHEVKEATRKVKAEAKEAARKAKEGLEEEGRRVKVEFEEEGRRVKEGLEEEERKVKEGLEEEGRRVKEGLEEEGRRVKEGLEEEGRRAKEEIEEGTRKVREEFAENSWKGKEEIEQSTRKVRGESKKAEPDAAARIAKSRNDLKEAREKFQKIQERLTYHKKKW
jgi:uncharacterized membrane protein